MPRPPLADRTALRELSSYARPAPPTPSLAHLAIDLAMIVMFGAVMALGGFCIGFLYR